MKSRNQTVFSFYRVFSLVLALHFLNISIDSRDRNPEFFPEDLTLNDIETMAEFFAEVVFGWQDAFAEREEVDNENGHFADLYKYFFSAQTFVPAFMRADFGEPHFFPWCNAGNPSSLTRDITAPPPRS